MPMMVIQREWRMIEPRRKPRWPDILKWICLEVGRVKGETLVDSIW